MADTALGTLLRFLREARGLSLRELAQLADVDHAYIYRLETGIKESPSNDILSKLIRALKAGKREAEMMRYVADHGNTDAGLIDHVLKDSTVDFETFASVASVAYRGAGRPDYAKLIERVRRIVGEEQAGGNG